MQKVANRKHKLKWQAQTEPQTRTW